MNRMKRNWIRKHVPMAIKMVALACSLVVLVTASVTLLVPLREVSPMKQQTQGEGDYHYPEVVEVGTNDVSVSVEVPVSDTNSPDVFLMKADNGQVISENHGNERIYPASMTKIMTAILSIEETPNFQKKIRIPAEMFDVLYAENASRAGFEPGEAVTVEDLIYGVLLPSGAECCLTLANEIAGSEEEFVTLMNHKAQEIGMQNTHFSNSIGLHDENHYSTAADMAMLLRYALRSDTFRDVFTSNQYTTSPSNLHPKGLTFNSTLFRYLEDKTVTGGQLLGGKTGYTQEAGQCLASLADIEGEEYILVTAGAPGDQMTEQLHIDDAIKIFDRLGGELEEWSKERS